VQGASRYPEGAVKPINFPLAIVVDESKGLQATFKRKSFVRKLMHDLGSASDSNYMQEMASYAMERVENGKLREDNFARRPLSNCMNPKGQ
jgi:hypothetical protein